MKILGINLIIILLAITQPASALLNGDSVIAEHEEASQIEDWMFESLFPEAEEEEVKLEEWMFE